MPGGCCAGGIDGNGGRTARSIAGRLAAYIRLATVGDHFRAIHEGRVVADQEQCDAGQLVGFSPSAEELVKRMVDPSGKSGTSA